MTPENGDFEQLQKALKLKRHEQPPPGYFHHFSSRVVDRIETRSHPGFWGSIWEATWVERVRTALTANPITSGIFAGCAVLMVALANSPFLEGGAVADSREVSPAIQNGSLASLGISQAEPRRSGLAFVDLPMPSGNPIFATNIPGAMLGGLSFSTTPVMYRMEQ